MDLSARSKTPGGAWTQLSLEDFSTGKDLIACDMIAPNAIPKKAAPNANHAGKRVESRSTS
jgi:fumarate hydratase class II